MACAAAVTLVASLAGCNDGMRRSVMSGKDWHEDVESKAELSGDLDEAEGRWRSEIAARRNAEDDILMDDPPKPADHYGKPASAPPPARAAGVESASAGEPSRPSHPSGVYTEDEVPPGYTNPPKSTWKAHPDARGPAQLHEETAAVEDDEEDTSEKVGKGAFAAFSVAFTLGMMALPYLLM